MLKPKVQDLSARLRFCACGNQGKYNPNTSRVLFLITNCSSCLKSDLSCRGFESAAAPTEQSREIWQRAVVGLWTLWGEDFCLWSFHQACHQAERATGWSPAMHCSSLAVCRGAAVLFPGQQLIKTSGWRVEMLHPSETRGTSYSPMS